jgi:hypothetical protein
MTYPGRSSCLSGRTGLLRRQRCRKGTEELAEAIVANGSVGEGPNLLLQGADGRTRWAWSDSKARRTN